MNTLDWALRYLSDGYSVIPLKRDKTPLLQSWKEYQTRLPTEDEVNNWFAMYPDALVGIVTGKVSGLCVVDVEKDGDVSIFPDTYSVRTGRGGIHLYYNFADVGNMVRVFPNVDVRGEGGYVVAPPSETSFVKDGKVQGGIYEIIDDAPKMPFPISMFQQASHGKFDHNALKGVTQGYRNASAASVIGFLLNKTNSVEYPLAWHLIKAWNTQNKPPMDDRELKITFESILKREKTKTPQDDIEIVPIKKAAEENKRDNTTRASTGFDFMDESSRGGIGAGELWAIAAPQGQGKTTLAMEMTLNLARAGVKSLWLSYELLVDELWAKFKEMGAPDDFLSYTTLQRVQGDISLIEKIVGKAVEQEGIQVVFIDHFGRLSGKIEKYDAGMSSNFSVYLALIAERLKILSLDKKVGIVLMAHTKKPERGRRQTTTDIANTSGLGNEATMTIILEREVDKEDFDDNTGQDKYSGKLFVKIDKSRWGKEMVKVMKFENGRILPWDKDEKTVSFEKEI